MALQLLHPSFVSSFSSSILTSNTCPSSSSSLRTLYLSHSRKQHFSNLSSTNNTSWTLRVRNQEDIGSEVGVSSTTAATFQENEDDPDAQDQKYVSEIKRILELLKINRDMTFEEVKLTLMIEDPRDVERKRLLGIDDENAPTRDDLANALEEVNEGKIPDDRLTLQLLAEEMISWPNLEVEPTKKKKPSKSLYAKATDIGVDPKEAARRLNIDWNAAAEIEDEVDVDDTEVPSVVGYGALYLVTALPVIIGISVVLILFYNSLQ